MRARKLGHELVRQQSETATREKDLSDQAIAEANARASEANKKAEQERLKRVQLEARISGRQITPQGQVDIGKSLLLFSGQRIDMVCENEPEEIVLMNQIITIMKSANWDFNVSTALESGPPASGVLVETIPSIDDKSAKAADALAAALRAAPMMVPEQKLDVSGPLEATRGNSPIFGGVFMGRKYGNRPDNAPIKLTVGKPAPPFDIEP